MSYEETKRRLYSQIGVSNGESSGMTEVSSGSVSGYDAMRESLYQRIGMKAPERRAETKDFYTPFKTVSTKPSEKTQSSRRKENLSDLEREIRDLEAIIEGTEYDWTDVNQRKQYDDDVKRRQAEISQKKAYLNQAKMVQKRDRLSSVADSESGNYDRNFADKSQYVSTKSENLFDRVTSQFGMGYNDLQYEYINNQNGIRDEIRSKSRAFGSSKSGESIFEEKGYDYLTEGETALYNYYYAKGGKEAAQEYLDTIQEELNQRKAGEYFQGMDGKTALELAFGAAAGVDQFKSGMKSLVNTKDAYIPASATQIASGAVREDLSDVGPQLPQWLGGASLGQVGYDTITTTANMVPSIMASMAAGILNPVAGEAVGTGLLGASAAGNAYQEMLNEGYEKGQARTYSALVGASEAGLQYLLGGISKLGGKMSGNAVAKMIDGIDNAFLRAAVELGGNMFSEGLEEGLQEVLTPWFQNLVFQTDEDVNWSEVAYSSLLGALTAGFMEGPQTVSDAVSFSRAKNAPGVSAQVSAEGGGAAAASDSVAPEKGYSVSQNKDRGTTEITFAQKPSKEVQAALKENGFKWSKKGKLWYGSQSTEQAESIVREAIDIQETDSGNGGHNGDVTLDGLSKKYGDMAQSYMKTYLEGQDPLEFDSGFQIAYEIGRQGGKKEALNEKNVPYLTQLQREIAYEIGQTVSKKEKAASHQDEAEGKTILTDTGETVKIQKVSQTGNDGVFFTLEDGREVSEDQISYGSQDEAELYKGITGLSLDADGANDLIGMYLASEKNEGTGGAVRLSAADYVAGVEQAFQMGQVNAPTTELNSREGAVAALSSEQRDTAYRLGKQSAKNQAEKEDTEIKSVRKDGSNKKQGRVHFDAEGKNLNERQRTSLKVMDMLSSALGVDIYVVESYVNEEGTRVCSVNGVERSVNGWYDLDSGSIYIDLYAGFDGQGTMLFTVAHELTHFIRQWSPKKFRVLADYLTKQYGEKGLSLYQMVEKRQQKTGLSFAGAYEEVVADSMESMLTDGNAVQMIADLKQQDKSLWAKIREWFMNLAEELKAVVEAYRGVKPNTPEGRAVAAMEETIKKLEELYADALIDASNNYQTAIGEMETEKAAQDGGVKYSVRETDDGRAVAVVDDDILSHIDTTSWDAYKIKAAKAAARNALEQFSDGITVNGITRKVNRVSKNEFTRSNYTEKLANRDTDTFANKMRMADVADDIVTVATGWRKDGKLSHPRKDNFVDFDHGYALIMAGENQYNAEIVVGITERGEYVFYDVTNIEPDSFKLKKESLTTATTDEPIGGIQRDSFGGRVSQNGEKVKRKFSMRDTVEETKDLIAVHNLSEEKLLKSLNLGGLPMPSIAILRAKDGHSNFGDISLVFGKDTIDPELFRSNKVYSGDAYTPTYPRVEYKASAKAEKKVSTKYYELAKKIGYEEVRPLFQYVTELENTLNRDGGESAMLERLYDDTDMMQVYLQDTGREKVQPVTHEVKTEISEDAAQMNQYFIDELGEEFISNFYTNPGKGILGGRKAYIAEHEAEILDAYKNICMEHYGFTQEEADNLSDNTSQRDLFGYLRNAYDYMQNKGVTVRTETDAEATREKIREVSADGYREWVDGLFKGVQEKEGIRNNKEYFTPSGNRRSFEALHYENTLENVVKAMRETGEKGIGFGGGSIFGASTTEFSSIDEIKSAEGRLQKLSDEEYQKIKQGFTDRFFELASSLPKNTSSFSALDDAANMLIEAVAKFKTKSAMANYLRRESQGWAKYSDYVLDDLLELVNDIRSMPTGYFEAKPQRAVGFDEVVAVVAPDNLGSEVSQKLSDIGVNVVSYEHGNEESRTVALNSLENVKFSQRDSDGNDLTVDQAEYFRNSKVRDENGNLLVMYHGTPNGGFTKFRSGSYFTQNPEYAALYQNPGASMLSHKRNADNPKRYQVYLNIEKPFDTRNPEERRIFMQEYYRQYGTGAPLSDSGLPDWTDGMDLQEFIEDMGYDYDGLILDEGETGGYGEEVKSRGLSYVTFKPEQVKNVDNLTPSSDPDIRFSERDSDMEKLNSVLMRENERLKEDVSRLKELLKLQKSLTGGTRFTEESVAKVTRDLMKRNDAVGVRKELSALLNDLYTFIATGDELTWEAVSEAAEPAAQWLADHRRQKMSQYAIDILKEIRGIRIYLDDAQKKEAAYQLGDYGAFRRKLFGNVIVTDENSVSLDSKWQELSNLYPNIFDPDISSTDMPGAFLDAIDRLRGMTDMDESTYDRDLLVQDYIRQVYDSYWDVSTLRTVADKKQKQIDLLKSEHSRKMQELREEHRESTAKLKRDYQKKMDEIREKAREDSKKKRQILKDLYSESREKGAEASWDLFLSSEDAKSIDTEFIRLVSEHDRQLKKNANADISILEKEFRRLSKLYDRDISIMEREFNRVRKEYEKADRNVERLRQNLEHQRKSAKDKVEGRKRTFIRKQIKQLASKFDKMATAPGKANTLHAPVYLTKALAEFCDLFAESQEFSLKVDAGRLKQRMDRIDMRGTNLLKEASYDETHAKKVSAYEKKSEREKEIVDKKNARIAKTAANLMEMRKRYADIKGDSTLGIFYDEHTEKLLNELRDSLTGTDIYEMDSQHLQDVYNTMKAMMKTIVDANKVFSMGKDKTLIEVVRKLSGEIDNAVVRTDPVSVKLRRYMMWQMSPDTFFSYLCGYSKDNEGKAVQKMFSDGSERMLGVQRDFYNMFRHITEAENKNDAKEVRRLMKHPMKDMVDWGLKNADGNPVKTSRGMMIQAYMLLKQEDSLDSLAYGGFKIPNAKEYYNGNIDAAYGDAAESSLLSGAIGESAIELDKQVKKLKRQLQEDGISKNEADAIRSQMSEIEHKRDSLVSGEKARLISMREDIFSMMTPMEREIVKTAENWYRYSGKLYGDIVEQMYGYRPNLVENYVSIHRDLTTVKIDIRDTDGAFNLENSGFTKERVRSHSPILLTDFFTEITGQMQKISRYYGFAQVQKDFNRIWNMSAPGSRTSIHSKVAAKYGTGNTMFGVSGTWYIENYIKAVSGANNGDGGVLERFYGNAASATLSLNPRVAFSQLASIPTASAVVGWKSMAAGFANGIGTSLSTQKKNDLAQKSVWFFQRYRGEGGITEIADLKSKGGIWENISSSKAGKWFFNWCQNFDVFATASMWAMAEDYVQSHGTQIGAEGYEEKVAKVYGDIIRKTQPNYTVTERSDMLRDKRNGMKILTMYKTQPNQNFNILVSANGEFIRALRDNKLGKNGVTKADVNAARHNLFNAVTSVTIGGTLTFVLLRTAVNFIMFAVDGYRDDDTDEVTKEETMKAMWKEMLSSISGMFALGGQLYDIVNAALSHDRYYGISDSAISNIGQFAETSVDTLQKLFDPDKDFTWEQAEKQIMDTLTLCGVPYKNGRKFVTAAASWYHDIKNGKLGRFTREKTSNNQYRARILEAWKNGDKEKMNDAIAVLASRSKKDTDEKIEKDVTHGFANEYLKDMVLDGSVSLEDARKILEEIGHDDLEVVDKWEFEMEHDGEDVSYSRYYYIFEAVRGKGDFRKAMKELNGKGYDEETVVSEIRKQTKKWYDDGEVTGVQAKTILTKYCGMEAEDAEERIRAYAWMKKHPDAEYSVEQVSSYQRTLDGIGISAEASGMSMDTFVKEKKRISEFKSDKDANGNSVPNSRIGKAFPYINKLNLTSQQKTALAIACGWSYKTVMKNKQW